MLLRNTVSKILVVVSNKFCHKVRLSHNYAAPASGNISYVALVAPAPVAPAPVAPAPILLYSRENFLNKLKFKHMLKLCCSFDSVRFTLLKI
jgi:hypothetical protein